MEKSPRKRILFYYDNYCGPRSRGGTEVATFRIARALRDFEDCEVFNAYMRRKGDVGDHDVYHSTVKLPHSKSGFIKTLSELIRDNEIDYVVNMGRFFRHRRLERAIEESGRDTRLLFMHHFAPGSEKKKTTYGSAWHLFKLNPANPLYWLRITFYPLIKLPRRLSWRKIYRQVYEKSFRVVLLSRGYVEDYKRIAGIGDEEKFVAIPNIYDAPSREETPAKEKRVLILSRMDEIQKRVTLALQIWKKIEERDDLKDWRLDIVGSGHDMKGIQNMAGKLGLERVTFHGWQESRPFLEQSTILMMTSDYEGLPLSMIEAQSYGCVPVAFDSYASLGDVVADNETGLIVSPMGDTEQFAERLAELMLDADRRRRLAEAGAETASTRFSSRRIASLWSAILQDR